MKMIIVKNYKRRTRRLEFLEVKIAGREGSNKVNTDDVARVSSMTCQGLMTLDDVKVSWLALRWRDGHDDVDQKLALFPRSCDRSIISKNIMIGGYGQDVQLLYIQRVNPSIVDALRTS